ncbi:MAG: hypothetical protein R2854_14950 [Caldilineaceae bacterium]
MMYEPDVGPDAMSTSLRGHGHLDRTMPGLFGEERSHRLQVDVDLAAEAAADLRGVAVICETGTCSTSAVCPRTAKEPWVLDQTWMWPSSGDGCGIVGLDVALVHRGRMEPASMITSKAGEALLQITALVLQMGRRRWSACRACPTHRCACPGGYHSVVRHAARLSMTGGSGSYST